MQVVRHSEHETLLYNIDTAYLDAVAASTTLLTHILRPQGSLQNHFLPFYSSFAFLYRLTSRQKAISAAGELRGKLDAWFDPSKEITAERVMDGLDLFDQYQELLYKNGILSIER